MGAQSLEDAATQLAREDPALVTESVDRVRQGAERDHRAGSPRGRAMVRQLRDLLAGRPDLGLAVARQLDLEHLALDLLAGRTVDGVSGLAPDGTVLPISRRYRSRQRGAWLLVVSALILLLEAILADGVASFLLYLWTAVGLAIFFVGGYLVIDRD